MVTGSLCADFVLSKVRGHWRDSAERPDVEAGWLEDRQSLLVGRLGFSYQDGSRGCREQESDVL